MRRQKQVRQRQRLVIFILKLSIHCDCPIISWINEVFIFLRVICAPYFSNKVILQNDINCHVNKMTANQEEGNKTAEQIKEKNTAKKKKVDNFDVRKQVHLKMFTFFFFYLKKTFHLHCAVGIKKIFSLFSRNFTSFYIYAFFVEHEVNSIFSRFTSRIRIPYQLFKLNRWQVNRKQKTLLQP